METLPELIKEIRALGMTQTETASLVGLSQAHISNLENGKRGNRTPADTLERAKAVRDRLKAQH
jgi:transcriptional regulator with XRE-family HTH domain